MKKILQVVSCLELGGTEAFIMNNYRKLDKEQYQFDFLVFIEKDYPYLEEIEKYGGKVFFCGLPAIRRYKEFTDSVIRILQENGPYIAIHSHVNIQNGIVLRAARKAGIQKRISHSHDTSGKGAKGIKYIWEKYKEYLIKENATEFLACSTEAGNYLYGDNFFSRVGKVIPNGIDLSTFISGNRKQSKLYKEFNIPENAYPIIGNITRFESKKNPRFTVQVFNKLLCKYPTAVLILGGPDGGQLREIKELVEKLEIKNQVRFIGRRTDIADCLKIIDIYLFPSLYEGLPIAYLEAQASGCFCVAATTVSPDSTIVDSSVIRLDLESGDMFWSEQIANAFNQWEKPDRASILYCFKQKGFEIGSAHKHLIEVYDEEK